AYTLGITHPPGHPIYCLLGRLFTFLPFGPVAYRVNLMSAFFASLTIVLIYLIILKIQDQGSRIQDHQTSFLCHVPAIVAALSLAFSKSFWSYALVTEIYTLKAFFLALLIFILLKWKESFDQRPATSDQRPATCTRYLYLFALIYGLSFSNHITMVLFLPAFLYFVLITDWRAVFNPKNVILVILLFTFGLSLYLYLPIRSLQNPPLDWGDPETFRTFIQHVSGGQYHYRLFDLPLNKILQQIKRYSLIIFQEFTWLPIAIGIFGLFSLIRRRSFLLFTGLLFLIEAAFNLSNFKFELPSHFYIPSFLIFSLWIGYGIGSLFHLLTFCPRVQRAGFYSLAFLLLLVPLAPLVANYKEANQSQDYQTYDLGRNILDSLKKDAILIGGDSFTYWYLQYVENQRRDVITISRGHIPHFYPWYLRQLKTRYPDLIVAPEEGEVVTGMRIRDREFTYPITEELWEADEARAQEKEIKWRSGPFRETTMAAITKYLIDRNVERHPIYLGFSDGIKFILPQDCYPVSNGLLYQIKRGMPRLVAEKPRISYKIEAKFSNELVFLGYDIDKEAIAQGDSYSITYYWKILKGFEAPPKVILLFTDQEGNFVIDQEGTFIIKGGKPKPKFYHAHLLGYNLPHHYQAGEVIREKYRGMVPSNIPPGRYYLNLTLMRGEKILITSTPLSREDPFLSLGEIEILPRGKKR
ncbi:MAG TPA: DUF2723 domain-containing protein, partial [bacterium]|nr:DUF2723 domain-containing protein [bacterium]